MSKPDRMNCKRLDDYLDGELNRDDIKAFVAHLQQCVSCRDEVERYEGFRKMLQRHTPLHMPDDADLRVRFAISRELDKRKTVKEVLDMDDAAAFLNITVPELAGMLDELPAFEIAGRIRFNRDRLIKWMKSKEKEMSWFKHREAAIWESDVIAFPGG